MNVLNEVWESAFWWLVAFHLAECVFGLLALRSARFKKGFFSMPILAQNSVLWHKTVLGWMAKWTNNAAKQAK